MWINHGKQHASTTNLTMKQKNFCAKICHYIFVVKNEIRLVRLPKTRKILKNNEVIKTACARLHATVGEKRVLTLGIKRFNISSYIIRICVRIYVEHTLSQYELKQ